MTTVDYTQPILSALHAYDLKQSGPTEYRCNSPLRPGSNSHGFTLTVNPQARGGGLFYDFVSDESGSFIQLARLLGLADERRPQAQTTKRRYTSLAAYAEAHYAPAEAFTAAGWQEFTDGGRPALRFPTANGNRVRYLDDQEPRYMSPRGYIRCWYGLDRALRIAEETDQSLIICNGEASTVVAQHYDLAAVSLGGGAEGGIPSDLIAELRQRYNGHLLVVFDGDAKGRKAGPQTAQALRDAGFDAVNVALPDGFDVADCCGLWRHETYARLQERTEQLSTNGTAPTGVSMQDLNSFNRSDAGNAELFAHLYGETFRYDRSMKNNYGWLYWDGARWAEDRIGQVEQAAIDVARKRYAAAATVNDLDERKRLAAWAISSESAGKLSAMLALAQSMAPIATSVEAYDANPLVAATHGQTLDLATATVRDPQRADLLQRALGTTYDPAAACPRWERFLTEVFANDQDLIRFVQRAIGYTLTGDCREQVIFFCHGGGANGKSVFLDVLAELMGDYAANCSFATFDAKNDRAEYELATLKGIRYVSVIETAEDRRLNEARIKAVTGQDVITARHPYGRPFNYKPQYKIWVAMNHLPRVHGTDRGIWRRMRLIPFTQSFEGREEKTLRASLTAELPGILNWALDGLRQWQAAGLGHAGAVEQATRQYQSDSDQVGRWIAECCTVGADQHVSIAFAYAQYRDWCKATGEYPLSQNLWGRRIGEKGFTRERSARAWRYVGLSVLTPVWDAGTTEPSDDVSGNTSSCDPNDRMIHESPSFSMEKDSREEFPENGSFGSFGSFDHHRHPPTAKPDPTDVDATEYCVQSVFAHTEAKNECAVDAMDAMDAKNDITEPFQKLHGLIPKITSIASIASNGEQNSAAECEKTKMTQCSNTSTVVPDAPPSDPPPLPDGWRLELNPVGMYVAYDWRGLIRCSANSEAEARQEALRLAEEVA